MISWNVHGMPFDASLAGRLDNIAGEILRRRPDLVLLQETWLDAAARRLDCRLRGQYERVPDPDGVRAGPLAPFGHRRGGLLALVRSDSPWKFDRSVAPQFVEFAAAGPLHRILDERDGIAGKGIQGFAVSDGSRRVTVLNTHMQAQYPGRRYEDVRSAQAGQLLGHARQSPGGVTLVAGDFNTHPGEAALYGTLTGEFLDLTSDFRRGCACGTLAGAGRGETHWIDYVLARAAGPAVIESRMDQIRNAAVDDPYSDHHGIWLQLTISDK